jgi:Kef-type K+ transport system membrane component KefB/mannitol/fructose-specific phosphotransferase system IIA component
MDEGQLLLFLTQVLVVLAAARIVGEVFRHFDQPPLAGEILVGLLLGKTVLGQLAPGVFEALFPQDQTQLALFDVTAQIGILLLLLVIGLEVDVASAWRLRRQSFSVAVSGVLVPLRQSFSVAVSGVLVPLALGTWVAWLFYGAWSAPAVPQLAFSLFVGAAVSITAITVVARLMFDLKIVKSDLGLLLISAMAINELLGWLVLAIVLGLIGAAEHGGSNVAGLLMIVGGTVAASGVAMTFGRKLTTRILQWFDARGLPNPATPLSFVVCLGLFCGIGMHAIGVHPIFGFLIAGVMAGDQRALSEHSRSVISQMVESIFVPLFFAGICLHVNFAARFDPLQVAIVTALSILGKFLGAWIGTFGARLPAFDRLPVAIAHMPGGSMGVLLAVVGRRAEIIDEPLFVAIVFASIASSLVVGPAFSWSLRRREDMNVLGFFSRKGLIPSLEARDRFGAIEELVRLACEVEPGLPETTLQHAARAREETMGTGIGGGIAVPHARLDALTRPLVVLGISKEGIEWNAIDDQPAHLVFLILTPRDDADSQLEILGTLARGVSRPRSQELIDCNTPAQMWTQLQGMMRKEDG